MLCGPLQKEVTMNESAIAEAAQLIWQHWSGGTQMSALPEHCRPANRAEGYAVQAKVARLSGQTTLGWKIAASSVAGQKHINVDGPLAGRLLAHTVFAEGSAEANAMNVKHNILMVAEPEIVFRMARPLPPFANGASYAVAAVMAAVETLHLAIEIPDTRYIDFLKVGAPSLIADMACAALWVVGPAVTAAWRDIDLSQHEVVAHKNGSFSAKGSGANVLGDPRIALTWIANELCAYGAGLQAGDYVTTGTCVVPVPVKRGDTVLMDFGVLGRIAASCASA